MGGIIAGLDGPLGMERLAFVEELTSLLRGAAQPHEVLQRAAGAMVPELADLAVLVLGDAGRIERLEIAHHEASEVERVRQELRSALPALRQAVLRDTKAGRAFRWVPSVSAGATRAPLRQNPGITALLERLGVGSLILVALRASGRSIGVLALARGVAGEPYRAGDLSVAQVLARRIALAVESARLAGQPSDHAEHRPHLEDALRKWTRVFDLAWWGAAVVDGAEYRIDTVNPAFAKLHGYADADALTGRLFADLLPAERADEPRTWPGGSSSEGDGGAYESEHRRADGSTFPVLVNVTPMDGDGSPAAFVVTVQDLTDLKRTEERLRRAQRMEAVGRLAGGVAHEVNNMMTIILGFGDLLARAPDLPVERKREVEEVLKAATRAGRITTQLLAFSRQQVLNPVDLLLNEVVEEIVPVLRLMLPANVRVETTASKLDSVVRADRNQLEQVLINLAFNARDAMPGGGTMRVATGSRWLDAETGRRLIGIPIPDGQYGLLSVIDTGHGMDPETVLRVFEPFFTTKPIGLGTGLGLSTVYGIIKQSGGYVWVESTPGQGTTITICLPETGRPLESPFEAGRSSEPGTGARTVLVVEDEDGVRELAGRILADRGHRVLEARNGREALAALEPAESAVDLVVTDVIVPDMGTDQLADELHRRRPGMPVLYMSGYPRDDIVVRGLLTVDQPFLQKPFTGEELADAVGRILAPSAGGEEEEPALSSD